MFPENPQNLLHSHFKLHSESNVLTKVCLHVHVDGDLTLMYRLNLKFNFCIPGSLFGMPFISPFLALPLRNQSICWFYATQRQFLADRNRISSRKRVEITLFHTPLHKLWRFPFHASSNGIAFYSDDVFAVWNCFLQFLRFDVRPSNQRILFARKETTSSALQPIAPRRLRLFTLIKLYYHRNFPATNKPSLVHISQACKFSLVASSQIYNLNSIPINWTAFKT